MTGDQHLGMSLSSTQGRSVLLSQQQLVTSLDLVVTSLLLLSSEVGVFLDHAGG